ncbi:hypothetical protein A3A39_04380 [Candidatus Kaiserbacteria bacterium RIFCSPLOWO2_01_FULL_54_13]|uniref:DoxX family protein n=1 Tax=Candidatus Kaiserbacteria bacterium RIFCSPLOWO2_01_FULL_54_13 TaxID=1798512 RepID=A0A1F6F1I8_9BACT|nr:MAG: hypothetical protein A3A39_04380 [Candidatus Kaiserbacteria bacterium RIFCSPLOWO2_01_FULL_54_13]
MLSVFPEILFLSPLAPFLIRLALGGVFAYAAWTHMKTTDSLPRSFSVIEGVVAILLVAGAWTQPAALGALLVIAAHLATPQLRTVSQGTALLALVMSASLLVTGAGAFAFDLPL